MSTASATAAPRAGRPREFDLDAALDRAIVLFSERGYHAASISDLTEAMGVAAGSLYKAFKDKKAIFLASFDRYKQVRTELLEAAIAQGRTGRDKLRRTVAFYAQAAQGEMGRRGCLVIGTASELAINDPDAAERVCRSHARSEARLVELLREGQADGSIPTYIEPPVTAKTLLCLMHGMRVMGKTGLDPGQADKMVDAAMKLLD
ncbi:TetR/AcrR family transcriptional regulator [Rhizobium sp. NTR19]|uniref:TetR/AcrR family transcriptional regulator n=1 Tax=Neorhizobium turbinariae TaxID=2937795 RepID=A0ABT0IRE0_9HYPH|nr:TetR/AcrR family transcriptional regulator [Neorhizobium turbinariae]MCK8780430.1 TetR/AcrR family transcriptional regulator [Neorhizobium turbinariae]